MQDPPPVRPPPPRCGGQVSLWLKGIHPGLASAFRVAVHAPGAPGAVLDLASGSRFRVGSAAVPLAGDARVEFVFDGAAAAGGAVSGEVAVCGPPLAFVLPASELDGDQCDVEVALDGRSLQRDPASGAPLLVAQTSLRGAAGAALSCELSAGLAAPVASGAPALGPGGPLLLAPEAPVLHVDGYPALVALRARVMNEGAGSAALRALEGDPAALTAARGGWIAGDRLTAGAVIAQGAALDETVLVPVASQAECVALGGEPDPAIPAPLCADGSSGGGLRLLAVTTGAQAECRARLRCGPDAPRSPIWSGARQFGWAGAELVTAMDLDASGALHLALWSYEPQPSQLAPHAASATVGRDGTVAADGRATAAGRIWRALARDGTGATLRVESEWTVFEDVLVRLAPDGRELWRRSEGTAEVTLAPGAGGTVATAGYGFRAGAWGTLVTKYDVAGSVLWQTHLTAPEPVDVRPSAVAIDAVGSVWVLGSANDWSTPSSPTEHVWLAKLDVSGRVAWRRDLPAVAGLGDESPAGLAPAKGGAAAIAVGTLAWPQGGTLPAVRGFDSDGRELWAWTPAARGAYLGLGSLAPDPVDGFWASATTGDFTLGVIRLDGAGGLRWARTLGPRTTWAGPVVVAPTGEAYVAGMTTADLAAPNAGERDAFVVRVGRDGLP